MMPAFKPLAGLAAALALVACAAMPTGPTVSVMPAPYKPFELFKTDDEACRQYARERLQGATEQAQANAAGTVAAGTVIGAAAGAAIGGSSRGAATGAVLGTAVGASESAADADRSGYGLQRRYDIAYTQCMYARGNQVPGYAPVAVPPPPPPSK